MTTITISPSTICTGGGHVHTSWQLNVGPVRQVVYDTDELRGSPSLEEAHAAVRTIIRAHIMGLTRAQARTILEAGISVTIE